MQRHNPYRHPLSIHPSGQITWSPPHNVQSSRPFHGESWLDHHWLQTGQSVDRMFNIVTRLAENRASAGAACFLLRSYYERAGDPETAYHVRWQVWTAMLNGAAGYGYGERACGNSSIPPIRTARRASRPRFPFRGAKQFGSPVRGRSATRTLLTALDWWKLEPRRDALRVGGQPNPLPTRNDLTPPHAASLGNGTWVIYVPRGNARRPLALEAAGDRKPSTRWFYPRTGEFLADKMMLANNTLPPLPAPAADDWVLVISRWRERLRRRDLQMPCAWRDRVAHDHRFGTMAGAETVLA